MSEKDISMFNKIENISIIVNRITEKDISVFNKMKIYMHIISITVQKTETDILNAQEIQLIIGSQYEKYIFMFSKK